MTAKTRLVTITIGGNDVGYVGRLIGASCALSGAGRGAPASACPKPLPPTEEAWNGLEQRMVAIVRELRRRVPAARIVLVGYMTVLPRGNLCTLTPMTVEAAADVRAIAYRLTVLTRKVARAERADMLDAGRLTRGHDACSGDPWISGLQPTAAGEKRKVPYHPNLAGMTAVAQALDRMLR